MYLSLLGIEKTRVLQQMCMRWRVTLTSVYTSLKQLVCKVPPCSTICLTSVWQDGERRLQKERGRWLPPFMWLPFWFTSSIYCWFFSEGLMQSWDGFEEQLGQMAWRQQKKLRQHWNGGQLQSWLGVELQTAAALLMDFVRASLSRAGAEVTKPLEHPRYHIPCRAREATIPSLGLHHIWTTNCEWGTPEEGKECMCNARNHWLINHL